MLVVEDYGEQFKRTYSDSGFYIHKIGTDEKYVDAIDLKTATFEYEETDEPINPPENEVTTNGTD